MGRSMANSQDNTQTGVAGKWSSRMERGMEEAGYIIKMGSSPLKCILGWVANRYLKRLMGYVSLNMCIINIYDAS